LLSGSEVFRAGATRGFELLEEGSRWPNVALFGVVQALADSFLCADAGGDVEQSLAGSNLLQDDCCLLFDASTTEHHSFLAKRAIVGQERSSSATI
jgi:hypothetical protein